MARNVHNGADIRKTVSQDKKKYLRSAASVDVKPPMPRISSLTCPSSTERFSSQIKLTSSHCGLFVCLFANHLQSCIRQNKCHSNNQCKVLDQCSTIGHVPALTFKSMSPHRGGTRTNADSPRTAPQKQGRKSAKPRKQEKNPISHPKSRKNATGKPQRTKPGPTPNRPTQ